MGWGTTEMLNAVCEKAGLRADAWRERGTRLLVFEVERVVRARLTGARSRIIPGWIHAVPAVPFPVPAPGDLRPRLTLGLLSAQHGFIHAQTALLPLVFIAVTPVFGIGVGEIGLLLAVGNVLSRGGPAGVRARSSGS